MSFVVTTLRRSLWLLLIGAVGGGAWSWWSDRNTPPSPPSPPEWPPLDAEAATSAIPTSTIPTSTPETSAPTSTTPSPAGTSSASFVNALVDAPDARSSADSGGWVNPDADGACPITHPVKANDNSGIFHVPNGRFYDRTNAERCYPTADAAAADGYRQAKA